MLAGLMVGTVIVVYLPFAMRTWASFIGLCSAYLLVEAGVHLGIAIFSSTDVPTGLVVAGNTWIDVLVYLIPVTVIARAIVLTVKSFGLSGRRLLVANILGILALPRGSPRAYGP